ncbi:hypothetical protein GCM10017044_11280 [Kordiimonas sediminis]|uniref:Uncharacterized protein n=1 Tax=Kordiimonas sediminis TaxID=1735581 RepID=A0A919AQF0_9PROT|nr:DUF6212 domain-containing protein [Kordiimonas sediminis]GHF18500.1 hypothetical protein GCM10017044_11280 [Kordiimonas sediminis]
MTGVRVSRQASSALFSSAGFIVGDKASVRQLDKAGTIPFDIFLITPEGVIVTTDAPKQAVDDAIELTVLPVGLRGVLLGWRSQKLADAFGSLIAKTKPHMPPKVHVFKGRPGAAAVMGQLMNIVTAVHQDTVQQLAAREEEVAGLRESKQSLLLGVERARRMMAALGCDSRRIVATIPHSADTAGPGGDLDCSALSQILPVDSVGITVVSLYVADRKVTASGVLRCSLVSCQSGTVVATTAKEFSDLKAGWTDFTFPYVHDDYLGDAELRLAWEQTSDGDAPLVALSDILPDRFGGVDGTARSLALKIAKGLIDPAHYAGQPKEQHAVSGFSLAGTITGFSDIGDHAALIEKAGFDPVSVSDDWIETRAVKGCVTGVVTDTCVPIGAQSVSVQVSINHAKIGLVDYLFALLPMDVYRNGAPSDWQSELFAVRDTDGITATGIRYCVRTLHSKDAPLWMTLNAGGATTQPCVPVMMVRPIGDGMDYGRCRWQKLVWDMPVEDDSFRLFGGMTGLNEDGRPSLQVSSIRFPEVSSQISFLYGREKLDNYISKLGFSPVMVNDELGYLQTHPIQNDISAAFIPYCVPGGTTKVSASARTAHPAAPASHYMVMVVKDTTADVGELVRQIAFGDAAENCGETDSASWVIEEIPAAVDKELSLTLDKPLVRTGHVVLAVVNTKGDTSFGWCRWYGLQMVLDKSQMTAGE